MCIVTQIGFPDMTVTKPKTTGHCRRILQCLKRYFWINWKETTVPVLMALFESDTQSNNVAHWCVFNSLDLMEESNRLHQALDIQTIFDSRINLIHYWFWAFHSFTKFDENMKSIWYRKLYCLNYPLDIICNQWVYPEILSNILTIDSECLQAGGLNLIYFNWQYRTLVVIAYCFFLFSFLSHQPTCLCSHHCYCLLVAISCVYVRVFG